MAVHVSITMLHYSDNGWVILILVLSGYQIHQSVLYFDQNALKLSLQSYGIGPSFLFSNLLYQIHKHSTKITQTNKIHLNQQGHWSQ